MDARICCSSIPVDGPGVTAAVKAGVPRLYRNLGDLRFEDVTESTGLAELSLYGMGVAVADFDGDGYRDLYLTAVGPNRLLRNLNGTRFRGCHRGHGGGRRRGGLEHLCLRFFDADTEW